MGGLEVVCSRKNNRRAENASGPTKSIAGSGSDPNFVPEAALRRWLRMPVVGTATTFHFVRWTIS